MAVLELFESGLPCVADPGASIVEYAHDFDIEVIPVSGPNSIVLALISSGMNGKTLHLMVTYQ